MRKIFKSKWFRIPYNILLYGFAIYGFFLVATFVAMRMNWTNDSGMVDANNRYFQDMHDKYNQNFKVDSISMKKHRLEMMNRVILLNEYYPQNAQQVLIAYNNTQSEKLALQMLDAVDLRLMKNAKYRRAVQKMKSNMNRKNNKTTGLSVFEWMNIYEWKHFKEAVAKDKKWIDSAARVTGVESRFIVSCLVGEQVRLFNSRREKFKHLVAPLKTLALENNLSYGVTGIKENTAMKIEQYLKDSTSVFYLGKEYEHLLDYDSTINYTNKINDTMNVRLQRLVQFNNHYYSYLYAAIFIKQIKMQWERAGYPIDDRPEILASLFNLGYAKSKPKKNPGVGGSVFKVRETEYTFGALAYEFYYSGELQGIFPYETKHFDWKPLPPRPVKKEEPVQQTAVLPVAEEE
jgi:hypothetical protein